MANTLKVQLAAPDSKLVSQFRNFGEDVYRALRDECDISIGEIDAAISEFHLRGLHKRDVRTIAAQVFKLSEKYRSLQPIKVYEIPESQGA